jgi:HK97 family phage portal protein
MKLPFRFNIKTSRTAPKGKVTSADERRHLVSREFNAEMAPNVKKREWMEFISDFKLTKLSDYDSYQVAGTSKLWASFHAVDTIAKAMISTPFNVKVDDKVITAPENPLLKFLNEPNPYDSWEEILYVWPFHIKYTGNAYWLKDEIDGHGRPSAVYPLLPQFIEIIPNREKKVAHYLYRVNGRIIEIQPEEMIHFKNPHPNNIMFGLGDMEAGEMMMEDYINRNMLEANYLSKGGVPSGVLVREEEVEDPAEWKKFTSKWKEEYEGIGNTGKTAFLNGKWDYKKLGLTPQELQTMERSLMTEKRIFTLHGVPLSVAGVESAANYATAKQDSIHFKRWTVMPMLDMFCSKLNSGKQFSRNFNPTWRMSYELGGMTDVGGIVGEYGALVDKGAMTRNELRKMVELEEIKGKPMMDDFLITGGLTPIDMAGMGGNPDDEELDDFIDPDDSKNQQRGNDNEKGDEDKDDFRKDIMDDDMAEDSQGGPNS